MLVSIYSLPVIMKLKSIFSAHHMFFPSLIYEFSTRQPLQLLHATPQRQKEKNGIKKKQQERQTFGIVYNFILFWIRFHQLKGNDHYLTQNFRTCNHLFRTSFSYENSVCIPFSVSMKIHNALAVQIQNSTEQIPITNVCIQTFKSKSKPSDNIK